MKRLGISFGLFLCVFFVLAGIGLRSQEVIDLTVDGADIYIYRNTTTEQLGASAATGDFNNDGKIDVAISARMANSHGVSEAGKVYVFYGKGSWPAEINLDTTPADLEILGNSYGGWLGFDLAFADLNNDNYDDLIIGEPEWSGSTNSGDVYILFGREELLLGTIDAWPNAEILRISGKVKLGHALACGDVNNNGFNDLVISAPGPGTAGINGEESFVFYGSRLAALTLPYTIDLTTDSADVQIMNYSPADPSGSHSASKELACGYINGDNYADILLGAPIANPEGRSKAGIVYAIYGNASPPSVIDLNSTPANVTIYGAYAGEMFGNALVSGDLNNDGYDDIIVGEWRESSDHKVQVFLGGSGLPSVINLASASADITILGENVNGMFGMRVATGNLNRDNYRDLVISHPYHQGYAVYGIYGRNFIAPLTINLNSTMADLTVYAGTDMTIDWLGSAVVCGDINQDCADDLIMGANEADPAGKVFIILGEGENYVFDGFFNPLENAPTVNNAKAGQAIPVKWRLTDPYGVPISDPASFKSITSYAVSCETYSGDPSDPVEEYSSGSSGLQYLGDGYWQFNWKTPKNYAGKCRVMVLTLGDCTTRTANFNFK